MKITGTSSPQHVKPSKKKSSGQSDAGFFEELMGGKTEEAPAPRAAAPIAPLAPMLGLQEVSDEETSRKALKKHGDNLLDQLDAVRHSLLLGNMQPERLERIRIQLHQRKQQVTDPAMMGIIEEIELRAEVELAKWEKFS